MDGNNSLATTLLHSTHTTGVTIIATLRRDSGYCHHHHNHNVCTTNWKLLLHHINLRWINVCNERRHNGNSNIKQNLRRDQKPQSGTSSSYFDKKNFLYGLDILGKGFLKTAQCTLNLQGFAIRLNTNCSLLHHSNTRTHYISDT